MPPTDTRTFSAEETANVVRWNKIAALLSMDVVRPFYEMVGFIVSDPNSFQVSLRRLILAGRREFPNTDPAAVFLRRERILEMTGAMLGPETRVYVERWGESVFEMRTQEHVELRHWTWTLQYCSLREPAAWTMLGIPELFSDELLQQFLRSIDTEQYESRQQEIYRRPLSDWDLHLYALHHFNDDQPPTSGPESYLHPTLKAYQAYRFWNWAVTKLSPDEQTKLQQNALRIISTTKHLAFIKELAPPISLRLDL
jgi:hypothetical protein